MQQPSTPDRPIRAKNYSLVLAGTFIPPVFQPAWLGAHKLIRENEAEKAEIKIIHSSVTQFALPWGNIQVVPERFIISMTDESGRELAKSLIYGLSRVIPNTIVTGLGINCCFHFQVANAKEWHDIGHDLVPKKKIWDNILKKPGTKSVLIQGEHDDPASGSVFVRTEPSAAYPDSIFVDINDHFNISKAKNKGTIAEASTVLEKNWISSAKNSKKILDYLIATL